MIREPPRLYVYIFNNKDGSSSNVKLKPLFMFILWHCVSRSFINVSLYNHSCTWCHVWVFYSRLRRVLLPPVAYSTTVSPSRVSLLYFLLSETSLTTCTRPWFLVRFVFLIVLFPCLRSRTFCSHLPTSFKLRQLSSTYTISHYFRLLIIRISITS